MKSKLGHLEQINYPSDVKALPKDERAAAYVALIANGLQDTLETRISAGMELPESDIDDLVGIIGNRCRQRTKDRIYRALRACPDIPSYGIYRRLHFNAKWGWSYCAGQDYRAEMPVVKKCLIGA